MSEVPTTRDTTNVNNKLAELQQFLSNRRKPFWKIAPDESKLRQQKLTQKEISQLQTSIEIEKSIQFAWIKEVNNFGKVFNIENPKEFVAILKWIQRENSINDDGILWPQTLEILYTQVYNKDEYKEKLPDPVKYRLSIYEEIKKLYPQWEKREVRKDEWVLPSGIPKVFTKQTYYWDYWKWPKEWTFIESFLDEKIPKTTTHSGNYIKIGKIKTPDWKTRNYLTFYKNWEIKIATFISLWVNDKKRKTKEFNGIKSYPYKRMRDGDHISSEYPEAKGNRPKWGSVMAYAIRVDWWIWIHSSNEIDWKPHSHGCIRTPLYYLRELFRYVEEEPVNIEIKDIY